MKLGLMIEVQEGIGWDTWRKIVRQTEDLGFDSLWCSDHFFSLDPGSSGQTDSLEAFSALIYAAMNSQRIQLGSLVLSMTFRHPAVVARMAAAVDQLSKGRFILGLGAGWNDREHRSFGITLPPPRVRIEALEEGVNVIRGLFGPGPVSYEGQHYRLEGAQLSPKPFQSPLPILIGGSGEQRTLGVVARHANEWNAAMMLPEVYAQKLAALEAHCDREHRNPSTIARSVMALYLTGTTQAEVDKKVRAYIENMRARYEAGIDRPSDAGAKPGGASSLPANVLAGTPSQLVEQIQEWESRGVSRIMLQHRREPDHDDLELIAREVLPKVS
jgi:F420-dependent oxidoreductase-like protein